MGIIMVIGGVVTSSNVRVFLAHHFTTYSVAKVSETITLMFEDGVVIGYLALCMHVNILYSTPPNIYTI